MRSLLFYLLLVFPLFPLAQHSAFSLIYKLSNEAYEEKVRAKRFELTPEDCQVLVGATDTLNWERLPAGYYIEAKVVGEQLELSVLDRTSIHAVLLNNERDFILRVTDSLGNTIPNANVQVKEENIFFDPKTETHHTKTKFKNRNLLKVEANGQLLLYDIDGNKLHNNREKFRYTKFAFVLNTPIRWGRKTYRFFQRGFDYGEWKMHWQFPLKGLITKKAKAINGYVVTDKPIYRYGDTLKLKTFVAEKEGKIWEDEVELNIYGGDYRKSVYLQPQEDGTILFNMEITDSLKLDRKYSISIDEFTKKGYYSSLTHYFRVEDYQLDEVQYEFSTNQEQYKKGEKIVLLAEGKDKNGFTITDGSVHIIAIRKDVKSIVNDWLYIPDTLWSIRKDLETRTKTQIILPDSLLPNADLDIELIANFKNSNGELEEKRKTIQYGGTLSFFELKVENSLLVIEGKYNKGKSIFLEKTIENKKTLEEIRLPYQERLNSLVSSYRLVDVKNKELKRLKFPDPKLEVNGFYEQDTVNVYFSNPQKLNVNYWISLGENIVEYGQTDSTYFYWQSVNKSRKPYYIRYQYSWKGESRYNTQTIQQFKRQLSLEVEQEKEVIPGQQTSIKVTARDVNNRKISQVNLTAGAVNAQFNSKGNVSNLAIPIKKAKSLKRRFNYSKQLSYFLIYERKRQHDLTLDWLEKFRLRDSLFYQLRHSKDTVTAVYIPLQDSFYQDVAQFTPYLIRKGVSEPIYMIYCNRNLLYYYEADEHTPYAFVGKEGYNKITIRTRKIEYEIDSVFLQKGYKLELVINAENARIYRNIDWKWRPDSLTVTERNLLKQKMLILDKKSTKSGTFIWQAQNNIKQLNSHKISQNDLILVGPFTSGSKTNYLQPYSFGTQFDFESGYRYKIYSDRERLYKSNYFDQIKILPYQLDYKAPKDSLILPRKVRYRSPFPRNLNLSNRFINKIKDGGDFKFNYSNQDIVAFALKNDSMNLMERFVPSVNEFNKLPIGSYTIAFIDSDKEVLIHDFKIKADTLLLINFDNIQLQLDTTKLLEKWFYGPAKEDEKFSNLKTKTFSLDYIIGYEVQGQLRDEESGEPLIYASINLVGTNIGTTTDLDGNYRLIIPYEITNPELEFSYTGYSPQRVILAPNNTNQIVDVAMTESVLALEEGIMVVAYHIPLIEQDNTTIGQTITSEEIRRLPSRNISALSTTTAGLSSADEGDAITIRGLTSNSTDYYVDGDRVSRKPIPKAEIDFAASGIRSNFQDYAYWNPKLTTDQNGEAYFTVTYPDNITSWNTFVVGMDKKLRAGVAYGNTKSYKPLLAQLATPRFLVEGDESDLIGKAVNYTNDTLSIETKFELEGKEIQNNSTNLVDGFVEKIKVDAPVQSDSLHFQYQLQMGDYFDGEKRSIPVVCRGMETVKGTFEVLDRDTNLVYEPLLQSGEVKVFVEGRFLNSALRSLEYLVDYPYGCNEQTASRLLGLLMKKKIYAKLEQNFEQEEQIVKMVKQLEKTQNKDGAWGWWRGNTANDRMSIYVTKVLQIAATEGYPTVALKKGLNHLALNAGNYQQRLQVDALLVLAKSNVPFNFEDHLMRYDSSELNIHERLATIRMRQILNQAYSLDSLYHHRKRNTFDSNYWQQKSRYWYDRSKQPTLLAYQILKAADKHEELKAVRQWFFQQRGRYGSTAWTNTYQTATILETILPEILSETSVERIQNEHFKINGDTIKSFPYRATFSSNQTLRLEKQGNSPVFFTAYQRYFETQPKRKDSLFDITSTLLQEGKKVNKLEQGKRVQLKVEVKVKAAAEYVMIEIPIPAACSYYSKPNGWKFPEVHREYFKEKTAIFCRKLEAGTYEFELDLEARFTGKYTLNPVRVEQMYFPVFDGNNELKRVVVRD